MDGWKREQILSTLELFLNDFGALKNAADADKKLEICVNQRHPRPIFLKGNKSTN